MSDYPTAAAPCRNIELKARIANLEAARQVARRVATEHLGVLEQTDTYFLAEHGFRAEHGRLKLRETSGASAQLVWYRRADRLDAKQSDYLLAPIADAAGLKAALAGALGVQVIVEKRREVFLYHNVRIHLDEMLGLGTFLEFEAVVGPDADEATCRQRLAQLADAFQVAPTDLLAASYSDMLKANAQA